MVRKRLKLKPFSPFAWLWRGHYRRQRELDIEILWPSCRDAAPDLDTAHAMFAIHVSMDDAWRAITAREAKHTIDGLK